MRHHIARPDQHHGRACMGHQSAQRRQFMIDAPAQKPQPQDQRHIEARQTFLKIRRALARIMHHVRTDSDARIRADRVKITDHPMRHQARRNCVVRAPVSRHQKRRKPQRRMQIVR